MSYLMELETDVFVGLIKKAIEKDFEDKLWDKWIHSFTTNMSFEEFKNAHTKKEEENKQSDDEIMEESINILMSISKPK